MVLALFAAFDGHSVTSILVYSLLFSNLYIFNLYCLICNFCLYLSLGELVSFTPCCPAHCNFQSNFVSVLSTSCANKVSPAVKWTGRLNRPVCIYYALRWNAGQRDLHRRASWIIYKFSFDLRVATSTFCTASGERQNAAPELKNNSIAQPGTYSQTTLIGAAKLVGGNFLVSILN